MWRILLFFHIRRSERKRLWILFTLPLVVWLSLEWWMGLNVGASVQQIETWESRLDSIRVLQKIREDEYLSSLQQSGGFVSDTADQLLWMRLGLSTTDAGRAESYVRAGGRISDTDDLERLELGDSADRHRIGTVLKALPPIWKNRTPKNRYTRSMIEITPFRIDINRVDSAELSATGLPVYLQRRWLRYLESGGRFTTAEDLLRLYGMDTLWVNKWKAHLYAEEEATDKVVVSVSLNLIDSASLCDAFFLAPWDARKVIRYRERLGGYFFSSEQLWELQIDSQSVRRLITLEPGSVPEGRVDLNTCDHNRLVSHPYIGWERAEAIEYYRSRVRPIRSVEDLVGIQSLDSAWYNRVKHYFK